MTKDFLVAKLAEAESEVRRWQREKDAEIKLAEQAVVHDDFVHGPLRHLYTAKPSHGFSLETPHEKLKRLRDEREELSGRLDGVRAWGAPISGGNYTVTGTENYLSGYVKGIERRNNLRLF